MPEIGQTLSHFKIVEKIGEGGMGTVFLAEDLTLDRKVALKFLPDAFTSDPERMARFEREAKLLASLNHSNIAGIYGLEQADGNRFLVLEYVEGETLQARLSKGALPLEDALELCRQIAEGLEAAHEKGVIHRDLKPANVMITAEEKVKILDFGLAKAFSDETQSIDSSQSPTLTEAMTRPGVILGTAAYMSPEQAKGKRVDKRADIWAFGCILYECLTGKKAFAGETVTETLAAILRGEPDWNRLPPSLHPRISLLLERCLEKHTKDRYGVISDARVDIQKVLADPSGVFAQPGKTTTSKKKLRVGIPLFTVTAILCLIIAGVAVWILKPPPPPEPKQVMVSEYVLPEDQQFFRPINENINLAVSRDGNQFAYSTTKGIYIRSMDELDARLITGSDKDAGSLFFSFDGQSIGYFSGSDLKLKRISINGGAPTDLCDATLVLGAIWYEDNTIVYTDLVKGIYRIPAKGGTPEALIERPLVVLGQLLPDGESVMFVDVSSQPFKTLVQSLETGKQKVLWENGAGTYLHTGHFIYSAEGGLFAAPFDLDKLEPTGGPVSILGGVTGGSSAISESGTLVYVPTATDSEGSTANSQRTLVWIDREGNEDPLTAPPDGYVWCKVSPDGKKLALSIESGSNRDIWIWDLDREIPSKLTLDERFARRPIWGFNGQRIFFFSNREGGTGIYWKASNNTGAVEKLVTTPSQLISPASWSPDGNILAIDEVHFSPLNMDIATLSMKDDGKIKPLLQGEYYEANPQIHPNGKWMAYTSNESGQIEVYVCSYPDVNKDKRQVSSGGGHSPLWSPDGDELYYCQYYEIYSAKIETSPNLEPGKPEVLFEKTYYYDSAAVGISAAWDIHPDGDRFLMIKPPVETDEESPEASTAEEPRKIRIVTNWFEELKEKVPIP
jgi:serine/threonine protein kinase/Tol biopolymer transport system component